MTENVPMDRETLAALLGGLEQGWRVTQSRPIADLAYYPESGDVVLARETLYVVDDRHGDEVARFTVPDWEEAWANKVIGDQVLIAWGFEIE